MKSICCLFCLGVFILTASFSSLHSAEIFSDPFKEGGELEDLHWRVAGQNKTGYATLLQGPYLAISGGSEIPDNNSQGWFVHGQDGWESSEQGNTISVTLEPPKFVSESDGDGTYFQIAWIWVSDGLVNPLGPPSPIQNDQQNLLIKIFQGDGDHSSYNLVQVYAKRPGEENEGALLLQGKYAAAMESYPSLRVTLTIDKTHYAVSFDQEMMETKGELAGEHGLTFESALHANLGSSNHNMGRGESRFSDFSISSVDKK